MLIPNTGFIFRPVEGEPAPRHPAWPEPADPWQEIIDLADADGWLSIYDFNNPNTWTLRNSGGTDYYTSIADGLGNTDPLVQATEANQPPQGDYDGVKMGEFNASRVLARSGTITSPRTIITLIRATTTGNFRNYIGDSSNNFFAHTGTYALLISDASSNSASGNNVFNSGERTVVAGLWASGSNNSKIRVNGSQVHQGTLTPPSFSGLRIGYAFTGQIGFVGVYQGTLTGTDDALSRMEAMLALHYGS